MLVFFVTLVTFATACIAEEGRVYRTVDQNGQPVYSDSGIDGQEIEVRDPAVYKPAPLLELTPRFRKADKPRPGPAYSKLSILSPVDDTAVRSNTGNLRLRFEISPRLQQNHSLQLLVDGSAVRTTKSSSGITLTNLDRGTHEFFIQVIEDDSGDVLQASPSISVTILRFSIILFKKRQAERERRLQ